jgi:hypothetical protein
MNASENCSTVRIYVQMFLVDLWFLNDFKCQKVCSNLATSLSFSCLCFIAAFEGFNATILAYGQTGSGESHEFIACQCHAFIRNLI